MNFDNISSVYESSKRTHYDWGLREYLLKVYQYMALALALTAVISMGTASSPQFINLIHGTPLKWVITFAPLGMAFYMGRRLMSMSVTGAQTCLMIFATLMGLSLSSILMMYTGESIARVFFITAGTFGAMSIYGYSTKRDLTSMGSFLMMGVIGLLIASVVNIFMQSGAMQFIISIIGVVVFTLLTAYDSQKIKAMYYQAQSNAEMTQKLAVYGSLTLYMDFINIFIFLLQLLGVRKND
jgi:FtsH-binding integral membrane protein